MQKTRKRNISPIAVVSISDITDACNLINEFIEEVGSNLKGTVDNKVQIIVTHDNGDEFTIGSVSELGTPENRSSNLIHEIDLRVLPFKSGSARVYLQNSKYSWSGGSIQVSGPPEKADKLISELERIFCKEQPLENFFGTTKTTYLAVALVIFLNLMIGMPQEVYSYIKSQENVAEMISTFIGLASFFFLFPMLVLIPFVERLQIRYLRRFIANWGDGAIKFERAKKTLIFTFWSLPVMLAVRYFIPF